MSDVRGLTEQQKQQFIHDGYLHFPQAIPPQLLEQLIAQADETCQSGYEALKAQDVHPDFRFHRRVFRQFLYRLKNFHLHSNPQALCALGLPLIDEIARCLCGEGYVNSLDMLLVKNEKDGLALPWHQDLIYSGDDLRVVTVGLYLEDSNAGEGALTVVPGSHDKRQDIDAMLEDESVKPVEIVAKAGDIVVHNPMLVHWSERLANQELRRTLYYEFRPLPLVKAQGWSDAVIEKRRALMALATDLYQHQAMDVDGLNDCYELPLPEDMAHFSKAFLAKLEAKQSQQLV